MDMLITNALTVVTCDAQGTIIRDGAVAVLDGRIAAVGKSADLEREHHAPGAGGRERQGGAAGADQLPHAHGADGDPGHGGGHGRGLGVLLHDADHVRDDRRRARGDGGAGLPGVDTLRRDDAGGPAALRGRLRAVHGGLRAAAVPERELRRLPDAGDSPRAVRVLARVGRGVPGARGEAGGALPRRGRRASAVPDSRPRHGELLSVDAGGAAHAGTQARAATHHPPGPEPAPRCGRRRR